MKRLLSILLTLSLAAVADDFLKFDPFLLGEDIDAEADRGEQRIDVGAHEVG